MIDFIFLDESHCDKMGIYRIWFGGKYYIGATTNTTDRVIHHFKHLHNSLTHGSGIGNNSTTKIINHLLCNQHIRTAFVELIEECKREFDLVQAEHKWLIPCKDDNNCLNYQFNVHRTIGNTIFRPDGSFTIKSFCTKNKVRTQSQSLPRVR